MNELIIPIPKYFLNKFPNKPTEWYDKYHMKYLTVLAKYTLKPYITVNGKTPINVPLKKMRDEMGTFQYNNERYSVWAEFGEGSGYIQVLKKGNNLIGKNSEIEIKNTRHLQYIIDSSDTLELIKMFYKDCDENTQYDCVPIDIQSLTAFIKSTEYTLMNESSNMRDTLEKNLNKAKIIQLIAIYFSDLYNGVPTLPQIISDSEYGRRYYKGINLQNAHKMLRHSCLGNHYHYDLKTAVYAIKLLLAQDIFNKQTEHNFDDYFLITKQYVHNKQFVRSTLGQYITMYPNPEELIKKLITAIGFGASMHSPDYTGTAIADIIKNNNDRKNLLNDEWLQEFIDEQKQLTDFITNYYLNDNDFIESIKDISDIKLKTKYNKKKVMSYIFQTIEYQIMDQIVNMITKNDNVLLRVHDAIYTRYKINSDDMLDIKLLLNEYSPYLELDYDTNIDGTIERQNKFKFTKDYDREEYLHKQFIKKEELSSKGYVNNYKDDIDIMKIKKTNSYIDEMLHTETYLNMDEHERIEYRKIMGITIIEDKINQLINE